MSNRVEVYQLNEISKIRNIWRNLEQGSDMTYFQSYDWYEMLCSFIPKDTKYFISRLFVVFEDNVPLLIAPLWIVLKRFNFFNKSGAYLLGRQGWSDYLNFCYDVFSGGAVKCLFAFLQRKYKINTVLFENLKEETYLFNYLQNCKCLHVEFSNSKCVSLIMPTDYNLYFKSLRKSVRQNIRTARNRVNADGVLLKFLGININVDIAACNRLREIRLAYKNRPRSLKEHINNRISSKADLFKFPITLLGIIYEKIKNRLLFHFPSYNVLDTDKNVKFMTAYHGEKLIAFFAYGIDDARHEIVVMAAGIDDDYKRYSPGMLLMCNFIKNLIESKSDIKVIDFTRGTERYKYDLGGMEHLIYSVKCFL